MLRALLTARAFVVIVVTMLLTYVCVRPVRPRDSPKCYALCSPSLLLLLLWLLLLLFFVVVIIVVFVFVVDLGDLRDLGNLLHLLDLGDLVSVCMSVSQSVSDNHLSLRCLRI